MEKEYRELKADEVVSVSMGQFFNGLKTFTTRESVSALHNALLEKGLGEYSSWWSSKGIVCKVLTPGKNWQAGKVKLSLVFCPEEVEPDVTAVSETSEDVIEYPLDEIRRSLNSNETP